MNASRITAAFKAGFIHLICTVGTALLAGSLVFGLWYPFPYNDLSGGRELFLLIVAVDVVCGPLLTLILFSPYKTKSELLRDLGLVILIQVGALIYGLHSVWLARPIYLVQEVDRFKVIARSALDDEALAALPDELTPRWWSGPMTVAIREPKSEQERQAVLFESVQGGRDYAERPDFYLPYQGAAAVKSLQRAKPLLVFLQKTPAQQAAAESLAVEKDGDIAQWKYLPVVGREDWIAVLDSQGHIEGFLRGDGF